MYVVRVVGRGSGAFIQRLDPGSVLDEKVLVVLGLCRGLRFGRRIRGLEFRVRVRFRVFDLPREPPWHTPPRGACFPRL